MSTHVEIWCDGTNARVHSGPDHRTTLSAGEGSALFGVKPGEPVKVQPFADVERLIGNRAMTTTVIIHPHPAPGLKVKVDTVSPIDGGVNTTEYLKAGDPVRTLYAHDGMAVHVSEVPEDFPGEVLEVGEGEIGSGKYVFGSST